MCSTIRLFGKRTGIVGMTEYKFKWMVKKNEKIIVDSLYVLWILKWDGWFHAGTNVNHFKKTNLLQLKVMFGYENSCSLVFLLHSQFHIIWRMENLRPASGNVKCLNLICNGC